MDNAEIMGSLKASYAHGEVVKYICPEYYLLEGQNFKKCENSIWTGKVGCLSKFFYVVVFDKNIKMRTKCYSDHF